MLPHGRSFLLLNFTLLLTGVALAQTMADVRGIIIDGRDGQAVPGVIVLIDGNAAETKSDAFGHFAFGTVSPGSHVLDISGAGYQSTHTELTLEAGDSKQFQVSLIPDVLKQTTDVREKEPIGSEASRIASGDEFTMAHSDLTNLSSVMADDPLRALQATPGVAGNDDFEARVSLRGADFNRTGIYFDGVLIPNALHGLEGSGLLGSSSIFNPALVDQLTLYKSVYSEKFGERSGGAVDVEGRDGSREQYHVSLMANIAQAGLEAEGPLFKGGDCSWIGGFRQSYIQSLLGSSIPDPSLAFSTRDAQGRLTCHAGQKNTLTASVIDSWTYLDRSSVQKSLSSTELMTAAQHLWVGNMAWIYVPSSNAVITNRASWIQDHYQNADSMSRPLGLGEETDTAWSSDATWIWKPGNVLTAGMNVRQVRGDDYGQQRFSIVNMPPQINTGMGSDLLTGGYLEDSWTGAEGHLHLTLGGRFDRDRDSKETVFSPQASLAVHLTSSTQLDLGYGQYTQFPALPVLDSNLGSHSLLPIRSNQSTIALEQRLGLNTRVRVEAYERADRDLLLQPYLYPRLVSGEVIPPSVTPFYYNAGRGQSRGVEFFIERKLAKKVSGWLSYAYGHSMMHDGAIERWYASDFDQRQIVSTYMVYAWKPSVTLSSRWSYGSGFPIPGYVTEASGKYSLSDVENGQRLPPYSRLDVRMNKTWNRERMKIRLFTEVENLLNATNYAFGSFNGFNPRNADADISIQQLFPILPSVGVVFDW